MTDEQRAAIQGAVIRHAMNDMAAIAPEQQAAPVQKIGAGHAAAMLRLGAHELTQALAAFPDSNIRPLEEAGVFGNPTPQIVTAEMGHNYQAMLDQAASRGATVHQQEKGMER